MAGALSGHVLDSYYTLKSSQSSGPFGIAIHPTFNNTNSNPWPNSSDRILTSGAMSFDLDMHGNAEPMKLESDLAQNETSFMNLSKATSIRIAALQAKLNQQLGPEYISTRPGPGGGPKLVYAEGWKIINLANEVFGFNGWSTNLVSLTTDFIDYNEETRRYSVGVTAILRVTLRDGVFHEDIGYGILENSKTKGPALDKCKKEAVTDALKRSLRNFGNLLGNCLYDKQYTNEIVKVKVSPPKFDKENLHRRPEFSTDTNKPGPSVTATNVTTAITSTNTSAKSTTTAPAVKSEPPPSKPISSIPPHVREQVRLSLQESPSSTTLANSPSKPNHPTVKRELSPQNVSTPIAGPSSRGSASRHAAILHGLNTPVTTPAVPQSVPRPIPPQQAQTTINSRQVTFANSPLANKVAGAANMTFSAHVRPDEYLDDGGAGDDSFALGSEDDAFFASVDLGDADMGRPNDLAERLVDGGNGVWGQSHLLPHQTNMQPTHMSPAASSTTPNSVIPNHSIQLSPPLHSHNPDIQQNQTEQQLPHQAQRAFISRSSDTSSRQIRSDTASSTSGDSLKESTNVVVTSAPAPRRMGGFSFPSDMVSLEQTS
ncbi:hypothetical protein J3R30DRAFT_3278204 [Lentinula aciculospora]|uniref:Recombination protein Rad52 n=1 Tax=Lentinula aciculospora TaxID=153920 RepID=A0A9W9AT53_9AGAR|nr:hypothetical protein J3R30DRAFT_3278204 [Lentinula aciculospora]